jgi:hypothetical protein
LSDLTVFLIGAALLQFELGRRTARRQLRAYVFANPVGVTFEGTPQVMKFSVRVENTGQTPAFDLTVFADVKMRPLPDPGPLPVEQSGFVSRQTIGPGHSVTIDESHPVLTVAEVADIKSGTQTLYLYGRARYRDTFGHRRETTYRYFVRMPNPTVEAFTLSAHQEGNKAT